MIGAIDHGLAAIALAATALLCGAVMWGCTWREVAVDARRQLRRIRLAKSSSVAKGNKTRAAKRRKQGALPLAEPVPKEPALTKP